MVVACWPSVGQVWKWTPLGECQLGEIQLVRCVESIVCGQPGSRQVAAAISVVPVGLGGLKLLMGGLQVLSTIDGVWPRSVRNCVWVSHSNSTLWCPCSIASLIPNCVRTIGVAGLCVDI